MRDTFEPSFVMDGAMKPMIISGTQNIMTWPSTYLTVTTTFITASLATRPTRMPATTATSKINGRLVKNFFMKTSVLICGTSPQTQTIPCYAAHNDEA